ncbi:MAG: formate dehydrogenase accessory sulfurtransferase FdhD [Burkholderiales bacterium]|nr:formate dehydrogenase accessory sulfurtransferase FdhD [Burkholderiales bacterium]
MPAAQAFETGDGRYGCSRFDGSGAVDSSAELIEEVPVALNYNGRPFAVMLATPTDLEDFAVGFTLTEGIAGSYADIAELDVLPSRHGVAIMIELAAGCDALAARHRALTGHGGCGLCGVEDLQQTLRLPDRLPDRLRVSPRAIEAAFTVLPELQSLGARTGAAHAAACAEASGRLLAIREDAGRHNALDKLIGHLARQGQATETCFLALSSRASSELVLKAAAARFELMAAISAPTGLAVRLAQAAGMTLVGFARDAQFNCYAGAQRLVPG